MLLFFLAWLVATTDVTACTATITQPLNLTVRVCGNPLSDPPVDGEVTSLVATVLNYTAVSHTASAGTVFLNGVPAPLGVRAPGGWPYILVEHTTAAGAEDWPWSGLRVQLVLFAVDGVTVVADVDVLLVLGTHLKNEADSRGLAAFYDGSSSFASGLCVGDVKDDGLHDFYVTRRNSRLNSLYINIGSGNFEDQAAALGVADNVATLAYGCAFADVDNDGLLDLYFVSLDTRPNQLFIQGRGSPAGGFLDGSAFTGGSTHTARGLSFGDVDADGDLDLYLVSASGQDNTLYVNKINEAPNSFVEVTGRGVSSVDNSLQSAFVDVNDDTHLDLWVANKGTPHHVFINMGNGSFTSEGASRGVDATCGSDSLVLGDYDGDGDFDVFVSCWNEDNLMFVNTGGGYFIEASDQLGLNPSAPLKSSGSLAYDWDNDGDLDIYEGVQSGEDRVWINNGVDFTKGSVGILVTRSTDGVAALDVNLDGSLEVAVSQAGFLWSNTNVGGGDSRYLYIRPVAPGGASTVFGATVRVFCVLNCSTARPWSAVRFTDGGGGKFSQSLYDCHFGLPAAASTAVYNATVQLPAGRLATYESHPRLGSISASSPRLVVVRPSFALSITVLPLYGESSFVRPVAGTQYNVPLDVAPAAGLADVTIVATINTQSVDLFGDAHTGYYVSYFATLATVDFPWDGLTVDVTLTDSGGLTASASLQGVPGTTSTEVAFGTDISGAESMCVTVDSAGQPVIMAVYGVPTPNKLLTFAGGSWSDTAAAAGVDSTLAAHICGWADVDDDGASDLLVLGSSLVLLYTGATGGVFPPPGTGGVTVADSPTSIAFADVTGDRNVDLVVTWLSAAPELFIRFDGAFSADGERRGLTVPPGAAADSHSARAADVDADGHVDVFLINSEEGPLLYRNNGSGYFHEEADVRGLSVGKAFEHLAVTFADYNGDAAIDIVTTTATNGVMVYVNVGGGFFSALQAAPQTLSGCVLFDFDMDGDLDVTAVKAPAAVLLRFDGTAFGQVLEGGLSQPLPEGPLAALDIDSDGDIDFLSLSPTLQVLSNAASPRNHITVRPVDPRHTSQPVLGATVYLTCALSCASPWTAMRVISPDGGFSHQAPVAHFGLPFGSGSAAFDVRVVFPGGSVQDGSTQPDLKHVAPGVFVVAVDLPAYTVTVFPNATDAAVVGLSTTLLLTLTSNDLDLAPSADCCAVNGVPVVSTFANLGGGVYTLTYVVAASHSSWATLSVFAPLERPDGVQSLPNVLFVDSVPAGDTSVPSVTLDCGPGPASPFAVERVCVACVGEDTCAFNYTLRIAGGGGVIVAADVPPGNYTSAVAAEVWVGPIPDGATVDLLITAVDAGGNQALWGPLTWFVDTTSPRTVLLDSPPLTALGATQSNDAFFSFGCTEAVCSYMYTLNGDPPAVVGGNATATDAPVTTLDTALVEAPPRVTNLRNATFVFAVNDTSANATVSVSVVGGDDAWRLPLTAGSNMTSRLVVDLAPGAYTFVARATSDAALDASPLYFTVTVDVEAPVATILRSPAPKSPSTTGSLVFKASEAGCRFRWRCGAAADDGATWEWVSVGHVTVTGLQGGVEHRCQVSAVDMAGNQGGVTEVVWTPAACGGVEETPDLDIDAVEDVGPLDKFVAFSFGDPLNAAVWGFEVSLDAGSSWAPAPDGFVVLTDMAPGVEVVLMVRAAPAALCAHLEPTGAEEVTWVTPLAGAPEVEVPEPPPASGPDVIVGLGVVMEASVGQPVVEYALDGEAFTWGDAAVIRVGPLSVGGHRVELRSALADGTRGPFAAIDIVTTDADGASVSFSGLTNGQHRLVVIASDALGSVEVAPSTFLWTVDTVPPDTLAALPSGNAFKSTPGVTVDVGCFDATPCSFVVSGVDIPYTVDAAGRFVFTAADEGQYTASFQAVDAAGSSDPTPASVTWVYDATPPGTGFVDVGGVLVESNIVAAKSPGLWSAVPTVVINATSTEPAATAGWVATMGGLPYPTGSPPGFVLESPTFAFSGLPTSLTTITLAAVDFAGNVDPAPAQITVQGDYTPPNATLASLPPSPTRLTSFSVGVQGDDDELRGSGMREATVTLTPVLPGAAIVRSVQVDQDALGLVAFVAFEDVPEGSYTLTAVATDLVGLTSAPVTVAFVVDLTPPTCEFETAPPAVVAALNLTVVVAGDEPVTVSTLVEDGFGVQSAWVEAPFGSNSSLLTFPGDGPALARAMCVDAAGNTAEVASSEFVVDSTPPVVSWAQPPPPYTNAANVTGCLAVEDVSPVVVRAVPPGAAVVVGLCVVAPLYGGGGVDGPQNVSLEVVDAAGHTSPASLVYVADTVAPSLTVAAPISAAPGCSVVADDTVCLPSAASFTAVCDDGGGAPCVVEVLVEALDTSDGCGRRLQAGASGWQPASGVVLPGGDGQYRASFRAADAAGNEGPPTAAEDWYVDSVPPAAPTLAAAPDPFVSQTTAVFTAELVGDVSPGGVQYWYSYGTAPGLPFPAGTSFTLADVAVGGHVVRVWAVDAAGNVGASTLHDWEVVDVAPTVSIADKPALVSGDFTPTFTLGAVWPGANATVSSAAIQVELNGGGFVTACPTGDACVYTTSLAASGVGVYTLSARTVFAGVTGDPLTYTWEFRLCGDGEYAVLDDLGGIACLGCPAGGNCVGGLTTQGDILALEGYWAPPASARLRFYECRSSLACLGGSRQGNASTVSTCATGYSGTLCAVCEEGFFESFGVCQSCGSDAGVAWVITFVVLLCLVGAGVLFFKFRALLPVDQLKVTLSLTQIIASANTAYSIPWPPVFATFLDTMRVFLIEAVSLSRANCAQPMTYYASLCVTLVAFKVVLVLCVSTPYFVHGWSTRKVGQREARRASRPPARRRSTIAVVFHAVRSVDWAKTFKITFLFLFVAYPGVSIKIMKTFKCVEVEGDYWLVADMRLKCFDGDWFGYALYAAIVGGLYTVGLPLAITVILWRNRGALQDAGVVAKWGFLYESYGVGAYLWEVVELLRKLWLSALVVLMAEGGPLQVTVAVLISGWAHVLHSMYKPWRGFGRHGSQVYWLQHASLLVTAFVFLMGLLFKVEGVSQGGGMYTFLSWTMVMGCAGVLVLAVGFMALAVLSQVRSRKARAFSTVGAVGAGKEAEVCDEPDRRSQPPVPVRSSNRSQLAAPPVMAWSGNPLYRKPGGETVP